MEYKKTLNMPKSGFPMRAGLPKREPDMLKHWEEIDLYNELLKKNEGKPLFSLHDGPPFSNGALHMGHALNKSLKDFITRMYAMRGYYTPYIPGWDNHGMPIESAIIKQNKLNHKAMSVADFRTACHEFADHYIDVQREGFKRMGVVADWEHPYKTMDPGFEAQEVRVFGKMYQNGHIYKGLKPVYWCPHDETALAEAEIEYKDDPCTTVYVKFPIHDDLGKLSHLDHSKLSFVIWTTTIWTLPGNLAIALHPDESYAVVKAPNGELYVMAEALTEKVMKIGGFDSYEIVETHPGSFFENMLADHPFLPKTSRLVLADYVTMDSGTGCVHTAPGFGADDYETCRRYGMDMVVPVDDQGKHTAYAGKYEGMTTDASNPVILQDMKDNGSLFASEDIVHSYPHCWRCKNPIIFRATPQWFCSVDSFKDDAIAACEDVRWVPAWGKDRMRSMILERTDWCISRQRRWGLPIPVFYCKDCGKPICTEESIEAVASLFEEKGSNAWFDMDAADILPKGFTCPHCGKTAGFEKETDTLDGWCDSGSTHYASMKRDQNFWPADMYLEGLDQYRGWFQSSLLVAVGALGRGAPFKECVTHGWTVDGEGKAMHKSLGNGMDPAEIFDKYGADRYNVITLVNSFHGRTIATLTATGQGVFHNYFGPFNEGFQYVKAGDIDALTEMVDRHTCAVMLELVQGEGGVVALEPEYVQAVRALCDEKDLVLIVDEVQTGVGRTGTFLCCEHYNLKPDIVTLAKGLGGGLPIGAVLMNEKVAAGMGPSSHGSTFGGNPVVCAGANVVVDRMDASFLANVNERAVQLRTGLEKLPRVRSLSGIGLMVGIEFLEGIKAADVLAACRAKGLLVLTAKTRLRLLPPLSLTAHDVEMALDILGSVLAGMDPSKTEGQA